ncbi:hypothetical protein XU18_2570 [Perkinsela sp. CCAP 1560/4]|nr:hypothetical protein XU18_4946 [Perkinsela sp. CCAP 1560/4]KNH06549.1 hypothetical protein XU18_2570 [Perkinsela sp. CCAP 1560/4]|eukprot:KNH03751.1 hypothetical protein XU18_4946 [Perkinsela sp. CCAP 1560/4]
MDGNLFLMGWISTTSSLPNSLRFSVLMSTLLMAAAGWWVGYVPYCGEVQETANYSDGESRCETRAIFYQCRGYNVGCNWFTRIALKTRSMHIRVERHAS